MIKRLTNRIPIATIHQYSASEEIANSITHGFGILFGIVVLTILLTLSSLFGTIYHFICYFIYGLSLILLYTSSTLYHALPSLRAKSFFKLCDHISIYLLIAGTYTPFLILNIKGTLGWGLLITIWSLAAIGIIFKLFFTGRFRNLSTCVYLGMGWMIIFAARPLSESLNQKGLLLVILGGLTYSLGTVFYSLKKIPFHHAIWHAFVLAGSIFHFAAIIYSSNF